MAALERAKSIDPGDYEIRRRLAEGHYAKGSTSRLRRRPVKRCASTTGTRRAAPFSGAALARLGRQEEAIASFKEAIAQRPEEPGLEYNLGLALEGARRLQEAEAAYARAVVS